MPQRPAARPVNKTHFSTPAKSVPSSPFPQDSSPRFDRPGPRNITLACLASPRRATPTAFPQLLSAPFLAWALPAPSASTPASLQARKPASLHCHKLPPTVSYYLPAAQAPRTTATTTLRRAHLPPASWALHCRAVSLASIGDIRRGSLCFCDVGRHAPYLVAVGNCPPAPGPQSTTIISPSVHQAYSPHSHPHCSSSIIPPPPAPKTRAGGRKEGTQEGRKGLRARARVLWLRGNQGPPRRQLTSTGSIPRSKPDLSF